MDMSEYKDAFNAESEEHLQELNNSLLELEQNPGDMEHINSMFRAAHTLKGMAATMGFTTIAELTHGMEDLMDKVRKHSILLDTSIIDTLFECLDNLEALVESVGSGDEVDVSNLKHKMQKLVESSSNEEDANIESDSVKTDQEAIKESPVEVDVEVDAEVDVEFTDVENEEIGDATKNGSTIIAAKVIIDDSCVLKAARSALVVRNASNIGNIIRSIPSLNDLEDEKFDLEFTLVLATKEDMETVRSTLVKVSEIKDVLLSVIKMEDTGTEDEVEDATNAKDSASGGNAENAKKTDTVKSIQSVRVNIERLDNLMNLVGELIINKIRINQQVSELGTNVLDEALSDLDRLTNEIQTEVMESRMVPIGQIFSRFPRMVRDLAKTEEKKIDFIIEGKDIELDRTVLDEIGDPLVHLLRNSVDHGIEGPEKRIQLGKSDTGTLKLSAYRLRNSVIIEVEDDGKGMDPAILRQVAVDKGVMSRAEADKLSDSDVINLIFAPGFSGAEKVTDVSGRGVGMDAVRSKIEKLGGSVTVESEADKGSKIQLQLPLTVAIIQSLMVRLNDEVYAVPLSNVVRDVGINASDIKTIERQEVIIHREKVLPLIRLHNLLHTPTPAKDKEKLIVVVVEKMGNNIGLIVDELLGQQEVIIKTLDSNILKDTKGFAGATILGNGSVALILDIATLI
ncbi:MAG: chemotaxis protein CheW [Methanosarcinaceae archaeon]